MTDPGYDETSERIGIVVAGKYRVGEVLGRGGMGVVYRGTDEELGGTVAVKFLHRMFTWDPALRERFRREAQALARLRHPGIVSLLHFGEHEGETFMVMELVTGSPLSKLIDAGPLSLPFVATIFDELLEVLELAHAAEIVHRDIKPSNVMVLPGDRIKLLDFGLVHLPDRSEKLTMTGIAHGTPDYMSPEQSQGEAVGPPSDVYSAGVLLYECIAGEAPFDGASGAVLMAQHLFVEPPPMKTRGHERDVPPALEQLVQRALAKKPHERPTAAEMRVELAAISKGTDAVTLARASAEARQRDALASRGERALTGRPSAALPEPASSEAFVEIRIGDPSRAIELRNALAVAGVRARMAERDAAIEPGAGAIVASAADGMELVRRATEARVPVLVVDVNDALGTRDAIRAGAADIVARGADWKVAPQVNRLLRRRR